MLLLRGADASESSGCSSDGAVSGSDSDQPKRSDAGTRAILQSRVLIATLRLSMMPMLSTAPHVLCALHK
eukprot:364829-Chlamydomonas_euryale.AAC.1